MILHGFDGKIEQFRNLAAGGNLAQSYIFYGDPQIGKAVFARQLAVFLETGEFAATTKVLNDFLEVWPEPDKDEIGISAANSIRSFLFEKPFVSGRRTAIVPEAERLTLEAQAALLKIVEEPPPDALIILILPNPDFLVAPLASRCQKIYFPRLPEKEIKAILTGHYKIEAARAEKVAADSFGRLGRALALVEYNEKEARLPAEEYFEEKILAGRQKLPSSVEKMSWLLAREAAIKRLNLNAGLQQKAAEEYSVVNQ